MSIVKDAIYKSSWLDTFWFATLRMDVSRFWWSYTMLGADFVKPPDFFKGLAVEWQDFNTQELLMATWGAATGAPEVDETQVAGQWWGANLEMKLMEEATQNDV